MNQYYKKNRFTFGIGTIGRDMVYSLISMFLMFYLTDVINIPTNVLWWVNGIILAARVFDACNDPVMGLIVDNTRSRFGKFKPWIALGALLSGILTILLFVDFGLSGTSYLIVFGILYVAWGISFTINDISYWSMLPSLSLMQDEREKIGSIARICANVGLFFVVAGIVPITTAWSDGLGGLPQAYLLFAVLVVVIMWAGQAVTLFGVREPHQIKNQKQHTSLRELLAVIFKNDQLTVTAIAMALFMIGYMTTTSFGLYFFKYAYGDEGMYSVFAAILGVSQIAALIVFPIFAKKYERKTLFSLAIILVLVGYLLFFFSPNNNMLLIGISGVLLFVGQAFVQIMMLMFLADSVDYGHWKLGKRNDSISFSLQPFINKMGGAVASGIVGAVIIVSGIKDANSAADVTDEGLLMMKAAMLLFPMFCILGSYLLYRSKYRIDRKMHEQILSELTDRGELAESDG